MRPWRIEVEGRPGLQETGRYELEIERDGDVEMVAISHVKGRGENEARTLVRMSRRTFRGLVGMFLGAEGGAE